MSFGAARPGLGRKRCPFSHHLNCAIPPPLWSELKRREAKTGLYPSRLVRAILSDALTTTDAQPLTVPKVQP